MRRNMIFVACRVLWRKTLGWNVESVIIWQLIDSFKCTSLYLLYILLGIRYDDTIIDRFHKNGGTRFGLSARDWLIELVRERLCRCCRDSLPVSNFNLANSRLGFEVIEQSI